jgi:phytoene desaturase
MNLVDKKVVIIGAGFAGLATANILARAGAQVTVLETHSIPGGRAGRFEIEGFTFDSGPSWYLMPEVFEHYFALLGENRADYISLKKLSPAYKVYFEDNPPITISGDLNEDMQLFDQIEPGAGLKLKQYLDKSAEAYNLATGHFLYTNFDSIRNYLNLDILKQTKSLGGALFQSLDSYASRYFKNPLLKQILEYPMVFLGTSPYEAPSIYRLMSHLDFTQGVYYPEGGIYSLVEALVRIGRKFGVSYKYNHEVTKIRINHATAKEVICANGESFDADLIISNSDYHYSETVLLDPEYQTYPESFWQKKQAAPSALLMYLGVKGGLPELEHHNLFFANNWQRNFSDIFTEKVWPNPASLYICKPSASDSMVAPDGFENLFVLVPGPAKLSSDPREIEALSEKYLTQLEKIPGLHNLRSRIVVSRFEGPNDFASNFNAWQGTALGMAHVLKQSAFFRPINQSSKVKNLYYVGAGTVPGIGLPMCLIGSELLYKRLIHDVGDGALVDPIRPTR